MGTAPSSHDSLVLLKPNNRKCSNLRGYQKHSIKREQAISALLTTTSICDAASKLSVAESTVRRWMQKPEFLAQYRKARRQCMEGAVAQMQKLTSEAVSCLSRNLNCGNPSVEVRAASSILEHAIRGTEMLDYDERIVRLEAIEKEQIS